MEINDIENLEQIHRLFLAFGSAASTVTETTTNEYVRQIDGRPSSHVKRVVEKFIDGKIPDQSLDFPPKPAQFGRALYLEPYQGYAEQEWFRQKIAMGDAALPKPEKHEKMSKKTSEGMKQLAAALKTPEDE